MVIDQLNGKSGTTLFPIDSFNGKIGDVINVEDKTFHFAKQKDLTGTSEIVADNGVDEPIISLGVSGNTVQDGTPEPETPIPIQNANDNGMSVVVHGTNLATAYQIFADRNKYTELEFDGRECIRYQCDKATDKVIEGGFKENTQYTLSCEAYATIRTSGSDAAYLYIIYYTDGTYNSVYLNTVNTWEYSKFTTKANKTVATISMRSWSYKKDIYVDVNTFQINEGTEVLPYEPYFRETIEIPTSITLNGKNVSLLFSEYDKLTVDRIANKVKYYEGGIVHSLTGNETTFSTVSGNGNNYRVYFSSIGISGDFVYNVGYCSHFVKAQWSPLSKQGTYATRNSDIIFRTDGVETLDDFKAFLQEQYANGTPVTFIIQRQTLVEHDITNTDLGQSLLALATRKGTNYFEISSDLAPSQTDLSYWRQIIPNE